MSSTSRSLILDRFVSLLAGDMEDTVMMITTSSVNFRIETPRMPSPDEPRLASHRLKPKPGAGANLVRQFRFANRKQTRSNYY